MIENIKYKDRLVAFIDILGWKDLVGKSSEDLNVLQTIAMLASAHNGMGNIAASANKIKHIRMSDASVFVADPKDSIQVLTLINSIISIHHTSLLNGILVRGSIVYGQIYYSDTNTTILGPALTKAYENCENGLAYFPRTIMDKSSKDFIKKACSQINTNGNLNKIFPLTNGIPIDRDFDDLFFITYLGGFLQSPHKEFIKKVIILKLEEYKNDQKIYQKYAWLKKYYNSVYKEDMIKS